ncbi:transcription factor IIIB 90 kDa subunit [Galleria mellonella]|uniref:B-related factor 1 n=1 Tax=Galleria mellonella TaxID=7137 RepID=A0ABM3MYW7_GALME|nr:transcription factor IIIB 90 kDa subunit [Galleria mellonella]XP_052756541.1 transcription factor IIIB 90 kDa subunit [Galleria mellonella]XP_052756542.1 transcription factor IIIB 90 kDa subunit [Galleria mellonella]
MSGKKCKHCGSSEIEVDPARGDAVCTSCGTVLEDNIIVAEVEFQENAHGGASAIGQFVSAESKGGATGFGRAFNAGIGQESRELTLRKAREGITTLCQQLRLNQQCIDIACNFFKMALTRHLTIGRPATHTQAACVYMTCRTERTDHLLIDISDALQICCYQLGRTYFRLSRALCIVIPPTDPCMYILRFASQLQFEDKVHDVTTTALRLVKRMQKDSIHSGRRPSGICGAALLIAARLHNFSRTPADVVRIVKVHESTLRKRLLEFGETPSSALTPDEFMTVDLEEEQDPPAFRAARKRDKERLQKLMDEEDGERELTELQKEIDAQLEKDNSRRKKAANVNTTPASLIGIDEGTSEEAEASRFAAEDTLELIGEIARDVEPKTETVKPSARLKLEKGLGPELAVIGLGPSDEKSDKFIKPEPKQQFSKDLHSAEELLLNDKDEDYISSLIMSEDEAKHKTMLWNKINAGYLKEQKIKEELRAKEKEEGKDKKKKIRGAYKKKTTCSAATAGEAIGKMLAEKKISSKINYDILKSLDQPGTPLPAAPATTTVETASETKPQTSAETTVPQSPVPRKRKKKQPPSIVPNLFAPSTSSAPATPAPLTPATSAPATPAPPTPALTDVGDDYDDELETEPTDTGGEMSLAAMLQNGEEEDYYDYEEY